MRQYRKSVLHRAGQDALASAFCSPLTVRRLGRGKKPAILKRNSHSCKGKKKKKSKISLVVKRLDNRPIIPISQTVVLLPLSTHLKPPFRYRRLQILRKVKRIQSQNCITKLAYNNTLKKIAFGLFQMFKYKRNKCPLSFPLIWLKIF